MTHRIDCGIELTDKAYKLYINTDPLDIEYRYEMNGVRYYRINGIMDCKGLTEEEVNYYIESLADEIEGDA